VISPIGTFIEKSCNNCDNTFDCEPDYALNECGDDEKGWIPITLQNIERLRTLRESYKKD